MNQWAQSAMTSHHGPLALGVAGRKQLLRKRLFRILGIAPEPARRRRFSCDGGLLGALVIFLICGFASVPFLVKAQEEASEKKGEKGGAPQVRIPGLHPVEREAIEKIERLVERSQALAKTEDGMVKEYSEPPQSEKLMDEAVQLLEIHCSYGSHPELLHLHRRVNLLAGRPEHAEAFQSWIVPSGHHRLAREFLDEEQWQAAEAEYRKAFETSPEKTDWWEYGYLRVLAELLKFDEAVEFMQSRAPTKIRRRKSPFPWESTAEYPAIPVPLSGFSSGSLFTGSRILSGEVNLSFTIGVDGRASLNDAVSSVDGIPHFPETIENMVSRWRFAPMRENGIAVETRLAIPFHYETSLPSIGFEVDDEVKIEDVEREVSKNVMTYGVCEARILAHSNASYAKALLVFRTCVESGATVLDVREDHRSKARIPAPPPPPPKIEINEISQLRLNHNPATLEEVMEAIRKYQAEHPNPVKLAAHSTADSNIVEKVKAACEQASVRPLEFVRFSGYVAGGSFVTSGEISDDGKTMLVSRPNRDGLPLLSVSSLRPDVGDQPDQPFSLPVLSEGSVSLDGQSVSFNEISNWRSLSGNLTGTNPGAVRLLLKPDATFGYALDAFEACQRGGDADISVSILGAP
ncbi:MAG: energy transducer TonB [Verrucomicrobiales bacterium]